MSGRDARIATGTIAAAVAASCAVVLALLSGGRDTHTPATTTATDASLGRPIGGSGGVAQSSTAEPGAEAAARRFFRSYLAVSYGRAGPDELRNATASLRERLRAQNARVPPGVRRLTPRVSALRLKPVGPGRLRATATVDDGDVAPYPLFATLGRRDGRWLVVSVGG